MNKVSDIHFSSIQLSQPFALHQRAVILVVTSKRRLLKRGKERGAVKSRLQNNKLNNYTRKKGFRVQERH